ncbi:lytic polysaccharide monooxygenase [Aplosporella prunicola CBS 121167]|uniref:Lytic polysaccharide monooxygenase n=1 Tax=Aplosporella prunicola CBS 121167 TaxID=1176127 RepID=A0A6A6B886_9PEZI|nr:lytic polysaccharide monooxygenase [Aplosporella prunicola CBS 121167]KAF2140310.1 lytic polysaccharide monooxygenase [Aplosporella prunicola CBS 121167]
MYISAAFVAAAMSLASSANAHVVMQSPTPYSGGGLVQVNPLDGTTYQFPCQGGTDAAYYENSKATDMTAGDATDLKFTGSAVHGGGSCQLSVTYENPPPKDRNKWKVIHSMEGGCPADAAGNIETQGTDTDGRETGKQCTSNDEKECLKQYKITIPKELKSGKATFAWTWVNKYAGKNEFYMNCAPINIQGGSDSDDYFNSLPSLFVANIPGECQTKLGSAIAYPNPGTSVEKDGDSDSAALGSCATETGGAGSPVASATAGSGSQESSAPAASATSAASQPTSAASNTGGVFAPSAASPTYTATSMATVVVSTSAPAATSASSSSSSSSGSSSGSSSDVDCSEDGALVCIGTSQFGICNRGKATPQAVAAGTTCTNGKIVTSN